MSEPYTPDRGALGKLRRRWARLHARRPALAAPANGGMVSFTFDDAPASSAQAGAAVLEARGVRGTWFIAAGLCGADSHMGRFTSREEVSDLIVRGHEVAGHTFSHIDCARFDGARVAEEADLNDDALRALGGAPQTFAYPFGELSVAAKREAGRRYTLARTAQAGLVRRGTDLAQAPAVAIEGANGEARALAWIARAAAERAWLILFTHDVRAGASAWGCTPEAFARIVDAALSAGLAPVTAAEGARRMSGAPPLRSAA